MLFLFLSISLTYAIILDEINKVREAKECLVEIKKVSDCIKRECTTKLSKKVEIKENFIICGDLFYKSNKELKDAILLSKIKCKEESGKIKCEDI